jgi:hypothetical protein
MKRMPVLLVLGVLLAAPCPGRSQDAAGKAPAPEEPAPSTLPPPLTGTMSPVPAPSPEDGALEPERGSLILPWGYVGIRGFPAQNRMAPNGVPYDPLFSLDVSVSLPLVPSRRLYLFGDSRFWGEKANSTVTNPNQGHFDFSKREYDLDAGVAWNWWDRFELRGFLYSMSNLNRGLWLDQPFGFKDGTGVENRYYFRNTDFDKGIYSFVSLGYYPSKSMVGNDGGDFKPGLFGRASLILELAGDWAYLFGDVQLTCRDAFIPKLLDADTGGAVRPFEHFDSLEFRVGVEQTIDLQVSNDRDRYLVYGMVRLVF